MSVTDDVIAGGVARKQPVSLREQVQIVELENLGAWWATSIVI
ncbi:hypothetical protein O9992_23245 [Vibrio lentus]|nr:hypothetical protein [Vibrio lentus]